MNSKIGEITFRSLTLFPGLILFDYLLVTVLLLGTGLPASGNLVMESCFLLAFAELVLLFKYLRRIRFAYLVYLAIVPMYWLAFLLQYGPHAHKN